MFEYVVSGGEGILIDHGRASVTLLSAIIDVACMHGHTVMFQQVND